MPTEIRRLTPHGLEAVPYAADSLQAAAQHESADGVYTITNTVNTFQVVKLTAHLERLKDSAERAGIPYVLDDTMLRGALRELIALAGYGDVRFRITIPRDTPDTPILSVEPFAGYPDSLYTQGVRVMTAANAARNNPAAKTNAWMLDRQALLANLPAGVYEVILTDAGGHLLEGTSSNFYAVMQDALYSALDGVLGGISRQIVFEVAPSVLPLIRRPLHVSQLEDLQEAFISSASRGIVPVVEIDGIALGDGSPGAFTTQLRAAYAEWVNAHLETL
ncbi:MAG: aminotransferase class IV [Phototrophicaceae bacterium]